MAIPLDVAGNPLRLVSVHAHPDDEASKGAGTVARYAAEGIRAALVCCTGGEEGDILNPAADTPEIRADLRAVREAELRASVDAIGYAELYLLGYRDSGMPGTEANARPDNFANAPLDEAVGRLVAVIRRERPQVLVTYGDEQAFYKHPDHLRVHEISGPAFDAAGDPDRFPDSGEPWQPSKLYYNTTFHKDRVFALHQAVLARGLESPYAQWVEKWEDKPEDAGRVTTKVPCADYFELRDRALLAHATQVDPDGWFFKVPLAIQREAWPTEDFELARSLVDSTIPEDDLFAGIRETS
jgi:mycothiol S-conjugate amidase